MSSRFAPAKKRVRFQDESRTRAVAFTAWLIHFLQPGSRTISNWKWIVALTTTVDFFLLPLGVTARRIIQAKNSHYDGGHNVGIHLPHTSMFQSAALCLDIIFILDLLVMAGRAWVWDLGFQDSTVEKLVDAAVKARPGSEVENATKIEDPKVVALHALNAAGPIIGPQAHRQLVYVVPRKFLLMAPSWLVVWFDVPGWPQPCASLLRIYRLFDLMGYLSERQEDMSSPVLWVAFFKFAFIIFATGHWAGCMFYLIAASSNFSLQQYLINWVDDWSKQNSVNYDWRTASNSYTYLVCLQSKLKIFISKKRWSWRLGHTLELMFLLEWDVYLPVLQVRPRLVQGCRLD
jgi:hypothetical protein